MRSRFFQGHQIRDNVGLAHVDEQIIFQNDRANALREYSISDPEIFNKKIIVFSVKSNLELAARMLLAFFLLGDWDNKVVNNLDRLYSAGGHLGTTGGCLVHNHGRGTLLS